jgi:hypothetical protein
MTEAETVAKGLTKAQREALGHIETKPWKVPIRWLVLVGYSLEALGLAKRTWLLDKTYLTPFGLAVRAAILKEKGK